MKLWIMRHGQAHAMADSDPQRTLTARGHQEARKMAIELVDEPLDVILASPYTRAQQTAAEVVDVTGYRRAVATVPWLTPDDDPMAVIDFLAERSEQSMLLVSHQPLVSQLISVLVDGNRQGHYPMSTASLACVELDLMAAGVARLLSLQAPAELPDPAQ